MSATPPGGSHLESLGVRSRAPDDGRSTRSSRLPATGAWVLLRGLTRESRHWGDFPLPQSPRRKKQSLSDFAGQVRTFEPPIFFPPSWTS